MQNNVTELTQKLRRSLDANYNVVDMPAVVDVISLLEKIAITKEQLEDTRLGRYVNELRRKTSNQNLAKRAKELVKKWRNSVIPDSNGQVKQIENNRKKRPLAGAPGDNKVDAVALLAKRSRLNGGITELDFSDNSNSSFKDLFASELLKKDVIMINSDSNSSVPDGKHDPLLEQQLPKKRGRKKGSKNHKNLLDEAETSFSNKMAVSRGNAKVKTTQELIASLQNRSTAGANTATAQNAASKLREDLNEKAAKLTERVSIIDQKLYSTNSNNFRNRKRSSLGGNIRGERVLESGVVTNIKPEEDSKDAEEEIIVVDDDPKLHDATTSKKDGGPPEGPTPEPAPDVPKSLSVEEALRLLPPIDPSCLYEEDPEAGPPCSCVLKENKPDFSVDDEEETEQPEHRFEFVEDCRCPAAGHLDVKYRRTSDERVRQLLTTDVPGVSGNFSMGPPLPPAAVSEDGLYANVVPNRNAERIPRGGGGDEEDFNSDDFKKYRISESADDAWGSFREWHECVDTPSYNGDVLRILPYVIID